MNPEETQEEVRRISERALSEAQYIISNKSTLRETGKAFEVSRTTVFNDIDKLQDIDYDLYLKVQEIIKNHRVTSTSKKNNGDKKERVKEKYECACGNIIEVEHSVLKKKVIKSCGCFPKKFKGITIGYIYGHRKTNNNTGLEGIVKHNNDTYSVSITLYGRIIKLGVRDTIKKAEKLRKWGEDTFYKPIIDEYLNLKENLTIEDVPPDNRIGNTEIEIINNHILTLGSTADNEISDMINKVQNKIKEYHLLEATKKLKDLKNILRVQDIPLSSRTGKMDSEIINNYILFLETTSPAKIDREIDRIQKKISKTKTREDKIKLDKKRKARTEKTKQYIDTIKQMILKDGNILSGQKYGELKVLYRVSKGKYQNDKYIGEQYKCVCSCGKLIDIQGYNLTQGTQSCGCLRHGKYKGVSLRYILGYKGPINRTGVPGVHFNLNNAYTVSISLYGKDFRLGVRKTLQEAKELREWAEELFYKPVVEEYYSLRLNLKVEDIPVDKRKGEYEEEIIGNYITYLGTMSEEEIAEATQKINSIIKEHIEGNKREFINKKIEVDQKVKDLIEKKQKNNKANSISSKKIEKVRKVKTNKGKVQLFKSKDNIPNSCGCGSYHYIREDDGFFIIDVCNSCGKDIGISPKSGDFNEWIWNTQI